MSGGDRRARIQARCPVDASRFTPMSRKIATAFGPKGAHERSAKAANALVHLLNLSGPPDWLRTELASPDLTALLSADLDHGSAIAENWLPRLKTKLTALGVKID